MVLKMRIGRLKFMDLKLRCFVLRIYHFIASLLSKTGIFKKISFGGVTLGNKIYSLFLKLLYLRIPEPIETHGTLLYHHNLDGRAFFGWLYYSSDSEPQMRHAFERIAKSGMTVVDVGAFIGYYTLLAAKLVGNKGKVYAFEPDPSSYSLLKKNIDVNGLNKVVEPFRLAISNREGKDTIFLDKYSGSSLFNFPGSIENVIDVISLDKFFSQRGWPAADVVKIDAEGADKIVLEGMRELVRRNRSLKIILEFNPKWLETTGTNGEELLGLLSGLGFKKIYTLSKKALSYKIPVPPNNIAYLVNLAREIGYLNLLCER